MIGAVVLVLGLTGFPMPIDYVDSLSTIPQDVKLLVYNLVKLLISERDPHPAELVTKLMNPQDQSFKSWHVYKSSTLLRQEPPAGFEPATPGLRGRCSTRLSYGGSHYVF